MTRDELLARLDSIEDRVVELFRDNGGIASEEELSTLYAEAAILQDILKEGDLT